MKLSLPDDWTSTDHQRGNNWRNRSQISDCWTVDLCQWGSRSFSCHLATNSGTRRRPWGMGGRACSLCGSSHFERKWGWSYWTLVIFLCCIFHLISTTNYNIDFKLTTGCVPSVCVLFIFIFICIFHCWLAIHFQFSCICASFLLQWEIHYFIFKFIDCKLTDSQT